MSTPIGLKELASLLREAARCARSILGRCWGGMALLQALHGIDKHVCERKIFGDFLLQRSDDDPLIAGCAAEFSCPQSRFAMLTGELSDPLVRTGALRVLACMPSDESVIVASPDGRLVAHLGHPEYAASRFAEEHQRDLARRGPGVLPPANVDLSRPAPRWRADGKRFFAAWLALLETGGA